MIKQMKRTFLDYKKQQTILFLLFAPIWICERKLTPNAKCCCCVSSSSSREIENLQKRTRFVCIS